MVDKVADKSFTLGGLLAKARKNAAQSGQNPLTGALGADQAKMADNVSLSAAARVKLAEAKKVDGYLRVFGAFLKLINAPQYGIKPTAYNMDEAFGKLEKSLFDQKV